MHHPLSPQCRAQLFAGQHIDNGRIPEQVLKFATPTERPIRRREQDSHPVRPNPFARLFETSGNLPGTAREADQADAMPNKQTLKPIREIVGNLQSGPHGPCEKLLLARSLNHIAIRAQPKSPSR